MRLKEIAYTRSGDKGKSVNIGVIAHDRKSYLKLKKLLTEQVIGDYFYHPSEKIKKYQWPKLFALNFILEDILQDANLNPDSQGKAFAIALLELEI